MSAKSIMAVFVMALSSSALLFGQTAAQKESAKSVVKITARFAGDKMESGSGFVWSQPDYIVTALHVVAGATGVTVYAETSKKEREAAILSVHQESGLALLKLKTNDLALAPLKVASAPNPKEAHYIAGYRRDAKTRNGEDLRFSLSFTQQQTLGNFFMNQEHFETVVGKQSYPQYQAQILRVNSLIMPGHSGAPVFDNNGLVVGVGEGGLQQGIARLNWVIPAQTYLAGLLASQNPKPAEPSRQADLNSAYVENAVVVKGARRRVKATNNKVKTLKEPVLHLVWTAAVAQAVISPKDLHNLQRINAEAGKKGAIDLQKELLDVYEDYNSGATIAVPHGLALSYVAQDRMFEIWAKSKRVGTLLRFEKNRTRKAAKQAMKSYEKKLRQAPTLMAALQTTFGPPRGKKATYRWEETKDNPKWVETEAFPKNWEDESDPEIMFDENEEIAEALPGDEDIPIEEEMPDGEEPAGDEESMDDEEPAADEESMDDEEPTDDEEPATDGEPEVEEESPADDEPPAEEEEPPIHFAGKRSGPFMAAGDFDNWISHSNSRTTQHRNARRKADLRTETLKTLKDPKGGKQGEMFTSVVFKGPNFLGTSVVVHGLKTLSQEEWKTYYLMVLCSKLAAFGIK
ncbi:MAG: serine protease [candidate division KSB1 bacterium]